MSALGLPLPTPPLWFFMSEFAYSLEASVVNILWKPPSSQYRYHTPVRGDIETLNLKLRAGGGGDVFESILLRAVRIFRAENTQSSRKQQLLRIPLSLEQMGIVFPGLWVRERRLCTHMMGASG